MKKFLKNQKGLTLVELLAVIVILGIIAAIAVPAIGNIIENSRKDAQIANAEAMYDAARLARTAEDISGATIFVVVDDAAIPDEAADPEHYDISEYVESDFASSNPHGETYDMAYVLYDNDEYTIVLDTYIDDTITDIRNRENRDAVVTVN